MKKSIQISAILLLSLLLLSWIADVEDKVKPSAAERNKNLSENYNISIFLDLSDRIDPVKHHNKTMEYYLRDVGYIKSVSEAFTDHVRSKKINRVNDKIQLFFDPEPNNTKINAISEKLKIRLSKNNVSKQNLENVKAIYATYPMQLYKLAVMEKKFPGSDIWGFFKNKVTDYCIEDNHRNILVILTDGYIFYDNTEIKEGNRTNYLLSKTIKKNSLDTSKWKEKLNKGDFGFIRTNNNLSNLEILVLGINPDSKNPYEEDVIKAYWEKWFKEMKVKRYEIKGAVLPTDMEKVIKNFINKKNNIT